MGVVRFRATLNSIVDNAIKTFAPLEHQNPPGIAVGVFHMVATFAVKSRGQHSVL